MQRIAKQLLTLAYAIVASATISYAQTVPTPTQTDEIIINPNNNGKADPGDQIRYKVTIQNTGAANATGTQLNVVPDPRTTLVPGTFRSSPLAVPDAYTCTGNVGLDVPAAAGVKANDFDDAPASLTVTPATLTTSQGGMVMLLSNGSFMYTPPVGFNGTDTYTYTLNDGNGVGGGVPTTDVATVTITVSNLIWFIDNSSAAAASNGRLGSPFKSLADFNAGSATAASVIYIEHTGTNYTGGIVLQNNEQLFGEGHTGGANLANVLPFTLAPNSKTLPAINGSRPVITNSGGDGVTLAMNNTLRGFNVGNCMDFGVDNAAGSSVGNLVVSEVTINNATGGGFDAGNGSGAGTNAVFDAISSTGGTNGINLTGCAGTFTTNGGTITNPTGTGILISGGSVNFTSAAAVSDNTGFAVDVDNHDSGNATFSGNITSTAQGIRVQNCGGGTKLFSGNSKSLTTATNTAVTLSSNTGATIRFTNGGLAISTTTAIGFNATGGGTVGVAGTGNTISSPSATALNVNAVSISSDNLTFQSISSGNNDASADPVNGIVLNNTGSTGGLVVTGNGGGSNDGSGGTIQRCSDIGIVLTNSAKADLARMNVVSNLDEGLVATSVNGLALNRCNFQNNGDLIFSGGAEGTGEANVEFYELSGTCSVTACLVEAGRENNLFLANTGSTTLNLSITQSTIRNTPTTSNQGAGCRFQMYGNTNTTMNISQNTFTNNFGQHFEAYLRQNAVADIDILNNTSTGSSGSLGSAFSINCIGDVTLAQTFEGSLTYDISNNNIQTATISAISIGLSPLYFDPVAMVFHQGGGDASGRISGNTIGTAATPNSGSAQGSCISIDSRGNTNSNCTALIQNNQMYQFNNHGIGITIGETNSASKIALTIQGNTIKSPGTFGVHGIMVNCGTVSTSTDQLCLNIGGTGLEENDIIGAGSVSNSGMDFRLRQRQSTTIFLPGYAGANNDISAVVAYIQGRNAGTPTGSAAINTPPGGGFQNTPGGTACLLP